MKDKLISLPLLIIFLITFILAFKNIFIWASPAFGDSPNFSNDLIKTYAGLPQVWRARGASFGGISLGDTVLSLIMFIYGFMGKSGLENALILKIIFLFPSVLLAAVGSYSLIGLFVKGKYAKLVGTFLYTFNTYFLLLMDGGQVGVALGYGLSPLVFLFLLKTLEKFTFRNFLASFVFFWLLTNIEVRFAAIILIAFLVYSFLGRFSDKRKKFIKKLLFIIPILFFSLAINSFWLYPLILTKVSMPSFFAELGVTNLSHSLTLFQPHWFINEFGNVSGPSIYFYLIPILILLPNLLVKDKKISALSLAFLIFAFLAKGVSEPLGVFYRVLLQLPFGELLRDSTKFFLPLMLFVSILISISSEKLVEKFKKMSIIVPLAFSLFLLLLIVPAMTGKLSGLFASEPTDIKVYNDINKVVASQPSPYRFLFFPERPAYISETYPGEILNANQLYKVRPFTTLIEGSYDKFFFLWDPVFPKLLDFTGVKNIFFSPDLRKKTYTDKELEEREEFLLKVSEQPFGEILSDYPFPVFQRENLTPRFFSVEKIVLVFGQDDIYGRLFAKGDLRLDEFPIIFAEDGTWPIENLLEVDRDSLSIIFYNKDPKNLIYRILAERNTASLENLLKTNWGVAKETIDWRNEAGKQGLITHDFDLGKGVVYSTIPGEKASYTFSVADAGEKNIAIRGLGVNAKVGVSIDGKNLGEATFRQTDDFIYLEVGSKDLSSGRHILTLENLQGFSMVNFIELFSDREYDEAKIIADKLVNTFPQIAPYASPQGKPQVVEFSQAAPTKYKISGIENNWLIFTEGYHPGWELNDKMPFPVFSFANAFYIKGDKEATVYFTPQDLVKKGLTSSYISAIIMVGVMVSFYVIRKKIERLLN